MAGIKIEVVGEKNPERRDVECLFREFGEGVHLIERRFNYNRLLMVISNNDVDVLFIEEGRVTCVKSENGKSAYPTFYQNFRYLKKLDFSVDELNIKVHLKEEVKAK